MTFKSKFELTLAEKVTLPNGKNVHKEVGKVMIPFPTLADFGIQAEQTVYTEGDNKGKPAFENGIPIYADPKLDWLQSAVIQGVQVKVRNKFSKGKLKPGMSIPEDFESLTAETARTGEALVLRREARADFENYLRSLNKKEAVVVKLSDLFWNSKQVLPTVSPEYLKAITAYVERWVGQLDETKALRFQPKIAELQESINAQSEDAEDLMAEGVTAEATA